LTQTFERVSEAAIIPATTFAFGNGILKETSGPRAESPPDAVEEPFGSEPVWILREGIDPVP